MSRAHVEMIAAVGPHWELGHKGGMPWGRIKGDIALFRRVTKGKAVVMGRKTWDSLPPEHRPLKGRHNIILSHTMPRVEDNDPYTVEQHINAAIWAAHGAAKFEGRGAGGIVIIGGGEVYRAALVADLVDVIHLSVIHPCDFDAWLREARGWADPSWAFRGAPRWGHDVIFPALNGMGWSVVERHTHPAESGAPYGWTQLRLVRDPMHPALASGDACVLPKGWIEVPTP